MEGRTKPFALETVLGYRKRLENLARQRMFQAQKECIAVATRLTEEETRMSHLLHETEKMQIEGIQITDLIFREELLLSLQDNLKAIRRKLEEKEALVNQMRQDLLKRSKERQIMEKLKDEQNKSWRMYLDKKEASMLDEIAVIRHDARDRDKREE